MGIIMMNKLINFFIKDYLNSIKQKDLLLKLYIDYNKLTLNDIAKKYNISVSYVSKIINGKKSFPNNKIKIFNNYENRFYIKSNNDNYLFYALYNNKNDYFVIYDILGYKDKFYNNLCNNLLSNNNLNNLLEQDFCIKNENFIELAKTKLIELIKSL